MNTYKVTVIETRTYTFEIEAETKQEAHKEAQELAESGSTDSDLNLTIVSHKINND